MIHAFLASIGWHAGTLVIRALGSLVLLSLPVLAIRAGTTGCADTLGETDD